jgi:hypothetical protein
MHDALNDMTVLGMRDECQILAITSLQDSPTGTSLFKKEEQWKC